MSTMHLRQPPAVDRDPEHARPAVAQLQDEFLSVLSHELRTPLAAILGWTRVLLMPRVDAATRQRGLEAIERNASAQAALIDDLLDIGRIANAPTELQLVPTDVDQLVIEAVEAARPAVEDKGLLLRATIGAGLGRIPADAARLRQVLSKLLSNAVKFTSAPGHVDVTARRCGPHVELVVEDTGVGIAPEMLPHVFDRFRQADSSSTRRHGGLGLGLAIVRHLVALHGGTVNAFSEGADRGARFVVRLPAAGGAPAASAAEPESSVAVDLRGLRLLVVDDEPDAREPVVRLLQACGAEVLAAGDAEDALRAFRAAPPDLLLSDIAMPGRDGCELLREIRALDEHDGGGVPAIAMTAFSGAEERARTHLAGYEAHLAKPVRAQALCETVAKLARRQ